MPIHLTGRPAEQWDSAKQSRLDRIPDAARRQVSSPKAMGWDGGVQNSALSGTKTQAPALFSFFAGKVWWRGRCFCGSSHGSPSADRLKHSIDEVSMAPSYTLLL